MKVLFAMSSPEYLRFYDSTILELARRGHDVAIAVGGVRDGKPARFEAIDGVEARITIAGLIPARQDRWTAGARALRGTMDFVRYLHPRLASAHRLRARVKHQALPWSLAWLDRIASLDVGWVQRAMRTLAAVERAIPPAQSLRRFVDLHDPDVVLVSPLVEPASDQVDVVKAAQARGTRVATLVASWDNLTNKGDLRIATGLIAVWNEAQKEEAVALHRVAPETVVVTGAPVFDRWFARAPSLSRDEFCAQVGLPSGRRMVLFTGSSIFIARADAEMAFVRRWIEVLRASPDPVVRDLAVLVRPHPYNGKAWNPDVLSGMPDVAVWPGGGYDPADERNRAGFFDSMFYSEAVVGINTSAMIEAAIVGRPVLSIVTDEFAGAQDETLHFHHLRPENGGFLRIASTLEQHARDLATVLRDPQPAQAERRSFVRTFVRPAGLERAVTPILVDALERYGVSAAPAPVRASGADLVLRLALYPAMLLAPLFPPDAARRNGAWRVGRESWQTARKSGRAAVTRLVHRPGRRVARWSTLAVRRARRIASVTVRAVVIGPARRTVRGFRLARYHAGVYVRRVRGASTE